VDEHQPAPWLAQTTGLIDNYPDDLVEEMDAVNNPEDRRGTRKVPFSTVLYIEQTSVTPLPKYYPVSGQRVRLRYAYFRARMC
jgi:glutaminyl-tRNA synthetase